MNSARSSTRQATGRAARRGAAAALIGALGLLPACRIGPRGGSAGTQIGEIERSPWGKPEEVIARINGEAFTRGDFYRWVLEKFGTLILLNGFVEERLFIQEAQRLSVRFTEDELRAAVEARIEDEARQRGGMDAMRRFYEEQRIDLGVLRREYANELAPKLLVSKVVKAMRVIDEAALREEYLRTFAQTQYRLSHIAYKYGQERAPPDIIHRLRTEAMEKAIRAVGQLRGGGDFAALARQESQDALTWHRGGDMGYATGDAMPPEMREAVLKLKTGEISDPVDNKELGSIHVFKVNEVVSHRGFEECREELIRAVKEREPDFVEVQDALFRLQKRARVEGLISPYEGVFEEN